MRYNTDKLLQDSKTTIDPEVCYITCDGITIKYPTDYTPTSITYSNGVVTFHYCSCDVYRTSTDDQRILDKMDTNDKLDWI